MFGWCLDGHHSNSSEPMPASSGVCVLEFFNVYQHRIEVCGCECHTSS